MAELAALILLEYILDTSAPASAVQDDSISALVPLPIQDTTKREADEGAIPGNGTENSIVKVNKGMIVRKSVEYIRYLQQLVSAQATHNRELEQQLAGYCSPTSPNGALTSVCPTGYQQHHQWCRFWLRPRQLKETGPGLDPSRRRREQVLIFAGPTH